MVAAPPHPHSSYNLIDKKIPITIFLTGNRDACFSKNFDFCRVVQKSKGLYKFARINHSAKCSHPAGPPTWRS